MFSGHSSLKIPKVKEKKTDDTISRMNHFDSPEVQRIRRIGSGSFGVVDLVVYKKDEFVIKEPVCSESDVEEFWKEAKLLSVVRGHPNVVEFLGVSRAPNSALMQEYIVFHLLPLELTKL